MKDLEVIEYLLEEMKVEQAYNDDYEGNYKEAQSYAKEKNTWLSSDIREKFNIEKQPDDATIHQNAKKIRKILLKMYQGVVNDETFRKNVENQAALRVRKSGEQTEENTRNEATY